MRRWLRPPRLLRPTRAGWCFFAITFGVGFAALNTGNNLLYLVLSLMLAFLALSGVLSESALRGLRVRRRLPAEIFAGTSQPVALEVRNVQRRVASFAIVIEDRRATGAPLHPWGDEPLEPAGRAFVLRVGPGERITTHYRLQPAERGPLRFASFRISTRFPFGLFLKSMDVAAPQETLVYPAVEPLSVPPAPAGRRAGDERSIGERGQAPSVGGIREWTHGDTPRRIHWRSSLRRDALLVRELEREEDAEIEVRLRTRGAEPGERFEESVRWAASEWVAHLDAGLRVALRTDGERVEPDSGPHQRAKGLTLLARVTPDEAGSPAGVAS